jgi:hypothetical protein
MTHKIVHTGNYLLIMDTSKTDLLDSSKIGDPIAHLPLNGSPILEGVDLLPPYSRHQEDGLEELAEMNYPIDDWTEEQCLVRRLAFKAGYNKALEKHKYTEEDMEKAIIRSIIKMGLWQENAANITSGQIVVKMEEIAKEYIQSLHQYPTKFDCEMVDFTVTKEVDYSITYSEHEPKPKTITTAQGVQWVGKYK